MHLNWGFLWFVILMAGGTALVQFYPDFHLTPFWAVISAIIAVIVVILLFLPKGKQVLNSFEISASGQVFLWY